MGASIRPIHPGSDSRTPPAGKFWRSMVSNWSFHSPPWPKPSDTSCSSDRHRWCPPEKKQREWSDSDFRWLYWRNPMRPQMVSGRFRSGRKFLAFWTPCLRESGKSFSPPSHPSTSPHIDMLPFSISQLTPNPQLSPSFRVAQFFFAHHKISFSIPIRTSCLQATCKSKGTCFGMLATTQTVPPGTVTSMQLFKAAGTPQHSKLMSNFSPMKASFRDFERWKR